MISGFRYGFLGVQDVALWISLLVLLGFVIALYAVCYYFIERGRGLRS